MAKFAFLLPRADMVKTAGRIADELGMEVVLNKDVTTDTILTALKKCQELGADLIVARGRQASMLKSATDIPIVELQLTGQEIAVLLRRARNLVPTIERPKIGVVTISNMIGDIHLFGDVFGIELHTYFVAGNEEMEHGAMQAVSDGMDVILGGDFVNAYCHRMGRRTLFFEGTEESLYAGLRHARDTGLAIDAEQKNTAHFQTLLNYSFNGILELSPDGQIIKANDMACKILEKKREQLEGINVEALIAGEDIDTWRKLSGTKKELYFSLLNVAGVNVVVNAAAVMVGEAAECILVSFYEMSKIERGSASALAERYRLHNFLAKGRFDRFLSTDKEMKKAVKLAKTIANTFQPVLVLGELGSGKTVFAQSIHNDSPCAAGPFVTFDTRACRSDQTLLLRKAIASAEGGTLCIEELGFLDGATQHELSLLLSSGIVRSVESGNYQQAHVRIIATSTESLDTYYEAGAFRSELYYTFVSMRVRIPPLRSRPEDLNQAIDMLVDKCAGGADKYVVLSEGARRLLMAYPWPGNFVQLGRFVERMVLTAPSRTIRDSYVAPLLEELYTVPSAERAEQAREMDPRARIIVDALAKHGGNRMDAAKELGISKTTLWRRMKKLGIYP